ncbi:hypothetical protein K504DRAFT_502207 [Pleomassaria siparia CBS 279.74]|uniref:Uncharacterized protein n=1 Tax=Pleomassaria siparia CBS 279.74 TaxID=1314801 RepID=A0A6G1K9N5_9PLEO|nr:hypothetical protein K504DRAFT_502207 [Pleomassaria siparia CBS 279.74]
MASTFAFAPHQPPPPPPPLTRTTSPFRDLRTPSYTPRNTTAKLWDECEKRALEDERRRDITCRSSPQARHSQHFSSNAVLDIVKGYDPQPTPRIPSTSPSPTPQFEFGFSASFLSRIKLDAPFPSTVAICKTCKGSIMSTSGVCKKCKRTTIILTPTCGESTPPLSPSCRNFGSTDLPKLHKESASGATTPTSPSPKRKTHRPRSIQLVDPPVRLSSLRPLRTPCSEALRPRKASLTDPNGPFTRLHVSRKPVVASGSPTRPPSPTTPPPTLQSHSSHARTRPSSLANITTPPQYASYPQHTSTSPSDLSTLSPYFSSSSTTTTSPRSVYRASCRLQNTTSAWDEWDSDEEEKAGLVKYWRGRKWRGSRGSLGGSASSSAARRDSGPGGKEEMIKEETRKKRMGFVRVISCGCGGDD